LNNLCAKNRSCVLKHFLGGRPWGKKHSERTRPKSVSQPSRVNANGLQEFE
jgi:hypothetical protein